MQQTNRQTDGRTNGSQRCLMSPTLVAGWGLYTAVGWRLERHWTQYPPVLADKLSNVDLIPPIYGDSL